MNKPGNQYLDDQDIALIVEKLKPLNLDKIILFGSRAYGEPDKHSDIDILVVTAEDFYPKNYEENMQHYLIVASLLSEIKKKVPIDLIVHTRPMHKRFIELGSMFSKEILQHGIVLYERDHQRVAEGGSR